MPTQKANVVYFVGMIERGFVEASSYTPSRTLSPMLHTVGDFVEVCYHGEKGDTPPSSESQTQQPAVPFRNESSSSSDWKAVEDSLMTSPTDANTLTFIPCESGTVEAAADVNEIVLCNNSPLSSTADGAVTCGAESWGIHSTVSKPGVGLSGSSSRTAAVETVATFKDSAECEMASKSDSKCTVASDSYDNTDSNVSTSADTDSGAKRSTQTRTTAHGIKFNAIAFR